jgi:hypothetical protein
VENLINLAMNKYKAYFANGNKVVYYYSNMKPKQKGIKLISNDYSEVMSALNKLRDNGLLILETKLNTIDILDLFSQNEIVYHNENYTQLIVIK